MKILSDMTPYDKGFFLLIVEVKPYLVNERLFSEPVSRNMFAPYDHDETADRERKQKEGTYEEPRFVR